MSPPTASGTGSCVQCSRPMASARPRRPPAPAPPPTSSFARPEWPRFRSRTFATGCGRRRRSAPPGRVRGGALAEPRTRAQTPCGVGQGRPGGAQDTSSRCAPGQDPEQQIGETRTPSGVSRRRWMTPGHCACPLHSPCKRSLGCKLVSLSV